MFFTIAGIIYALSMHYLCIIYASFMYYLYIFFIIYTPNFKDI